MPTDHQASASARKPPEVAFSSSDVPIDYLDCFTNSATSVNGRKTIDRTAAAAVADELMLWGEGTLDGVQDQSAIAKTIDRLNHGSGSFFTEEPEVRNQHFINQVAYSLFEISEQNSRKPSVRMRFDPSGNITDIAFGRRPGTIPENLLYEWVFKPYMGWKDRVDLEF